MQHIQARLAQKFKECFHCRHTLEINGRDSILFSYWNLIEGKNMTQEKYTRMISISYVNDISSNSGVASMRTRSEKCGLCQVKIGTSYSSTHLRITT